MSATMPIADLKAGRSECGQEGAQANQTKPLVSVVVPAYNEADILQENLELLCNYLASIEDEYDWEVVVVNDGSTDETGQLAEDFAITHRNVHVLHHPKNFGIGQAFQYAFSHCAGDFVVVLDVDLSYSPDHVGQLLTKIRKTKAKVVTASPYMEGGHVTNVPPMRKALSIWANRFLAAVAKGHLTTLTGMVRVYDGPFLRTLTLKSMGMEVNPEIIYKAKLLQAQIEEVPAHLDWRHTKKTVGTRRRSSMKLVQHTMAVAVSGFIFRPFILFTLPGFLLLMFSSYVNAWMVIHFLAQYSRLSQYTWFLDRASNAVAAAYQQFPHTFIVGLLSLILSIQLIGLGVMSYQSKRYFEEIFYLCTHIYKAQRKEPYYRG